MGLYDFTYYDLIERNSNLYGRKVCWRDREDGRTLTCLEYKQQVDSLAAGLARAGVGKGDRIGVVGKNCLEFFLLYGAAACLGAIVLPVNWRLSVEEICFNLNDCSPRLLFVDEEFQQDLVDSRDQLESVQTFYNLSEDRGQCASFLSLMEEGEGKPTEVRGDDGFVIIHTAAVSGRPRGALVSHNNLVLANLHLASSLGLREGDVHLGMLPLFHVAGLFMLTATLQAGGTTVNMRRFDADIAAQLIAEEGVTHFFEFPPILDSILKAAEKSGRDLSSLRSVIGLGTPEVIESFHRCTSGEYYVMYGQTETSCLASIGRYRDRPGSAGRVISVGSVILVDDYDQPVAPGELGEICLKGPMVFKGYWNLEDENRYTFREGYHHTGDLGRFDEDGFLFYGGRKAEKELIKPGGENVYPAEVEKVILEHPAVARAVVIGVPDPKWKEGIKAVVELGENQSLDARELIDFVGRRIASFKKPQYVDVVDSLPLLENGEIDRQRVKEEYGAGTL